MVKTIDDRSPMAKSLSKGTEIIAICMMMIVPGLIGFWVDQRFGSRIVFTLLGLILGMTVAVMQLVQLVSVSNKPKGDLDDSSVDDSSDET